MPRRQIRAARQSAELATTLIDEDDLPDDVNGSAIFGRKAPLELEIGSGKGLFLASEAPMNPDRDYLGIEIIKKYAALAASRVARSGVANAKVIAGDAGPIVADRMGENCLDAIHVYFPDPWWKKRHRHRRVVSRDSVLQFRRVLKPGGRLHFWTDVLDYFENTIELIAEFAPEFGVPYPESVSPAQHDLDYRTHFERRSRQHQIPVYRVCYRNRD